MSIEKYRHPVLFYFLSTAFPWLFWFLAAYLSHLNPGSELTRTAMSAFCIIGLVCPTIIALVMIYPDRGLRRDLARRFFNFGEIRPVYLVLTCFLMPGSILAAQAISLLFGHSAEQFLFADRFSFTAGIFPAWFLIILAPIIEELAWHSYGTDCLRNRFNLFLTSMIFAVYWVLWHFPLSFIKDYYHANLAESGVLYSLNFAVSLIPFVILMNWLYYKSGRNILVAVVFHITAGLFNEIFRTHPDSKVIQTGLLLILSIYLLIRERDFFFRREYGHENPGELNTRVTESPNPLKA